MKKLLKHVVWVSIVITIGYYFLMNYFGGSQRNYIELLGYTLVIIIIPLIIASLSTFVRKGNGKYNWERFNKTFSISWILVFAFFVIKGFDNLPKNQAVSDAKELITSMSKEAIEKRREYNNRLININFPEMKMESSELKNIELMKAYRESIIQQKDVEDWNHKTFLNYNIVSRNRITKFQEEHSGKDVDTMISLFNRNLDLYLNYIVLLRESQIRYFNSHIDYIDFILKNNECISVINDQIIIRDEGIRESYNELYSDFQNSLNDYVIITNQLKEKLIIGLKENNRLLNISEVDTLHDMLKYEKYY